MKEIFFINDTVENKISYYHLLAFLAALPFDRLYSQVIFISFTIHTLIHIKKKKTSLALNKTVFISVALFLLQFVSILYSQEKANAVRELGRQLPILIFPLLFAFTTLDYSKYKIQLLLFFSLVCTLTIIYLFVESFRIIISYNLPFNVLFSSVFINHNFSAPVGMHATYLSMYAALSLVCCLYFLVTSSTFLRKIFYGIAICILSAGLLLLSSRSVIIALFLILVIFPFMILKGKKIIQYSLILASLLLLFFIATMQIDSLRTRFTRDLGQELAESSETGIILEPRVARWKCAAELIKKSPFIGYGSGSEKKLLKEKYFEQKLYISYLNSLDAHNQYLSYLIKAGILGLGVFFFVLLSGFKVALREKNIFFTAFLVLVTVVSVSENILDVNKGIFFFSFFFSLFFVRQQVTLKQ